MTRFSSHSPISRWLASPNTATNASAEKNLSPYRLAARNTRRTSGNKQSKRASTAASTTSGTPGRPAAMASAISSRNMGLPSQRSSTKCSTSAGSGKFRMRSRLNPALRGKGASRMVSTMRSPHKPGNSSSTSGRPRANTSSG